MFNFFKSMKKKTNDKEILYKKAMKSLDNGKVQIGMNILYQLALEDYAQAEYSLGDIHEFILNDYQQATKWYDFAAQHGHAQAQFCLANMLMTGKGTPTDSKEAAHWYRIAAENGIADAQFVMGELLRVGKVIPQDLLEARKWYTLAIKNGFKLAQMRIEQMDAVGGDKEDIPIPAKNINDLIVSEDMNEIPSEVLMARGLDYFIGDGIPQDMEKAAEYIKAAAVKGLPDAQFMFGKMYCGAQGVEKNYEKALFWLKKAAGQNHPESNFEVAKFYDNGIGVEKNTTIAEEYLQKAASLGHNVSKEALKRRKNR